MENQEKMLDLVIIGAAAAGCTAAIYAARRKLNFVVVSKDIGGEVALSGVVENWPGTETISGIELSQNFHKHALSYGVQFDNGFEVKSIEQVKNYHVVHAENFSGEKKEYQTKAVIVASGIHPRELKIPGENEYKNKGVTFCTVCDGPLYKGKTTATIGAGNAALESALMMAEIAEKVYLVTKYPESNLGGFPKGETILVDKVKEKSNVEIIYNSFTSEILGNEMVTGIKYQENGSEEEKQVDGINGVMVHIGMIPNSGFVECASKNKAKEIEVDIRCKTNCTGLFAAGDVTNIPFKQISISAGQGATAALSAIEYINLWEPEQ